MPPPRAASPPLPPKPAAPPPQLPPRPASPTRALPPLPPLPNPAVDALAAEVERLRDELGRAQAALAQEAQRSKQLSEAAAGAQFKYDLLVDMVRTLRLLYAVLAVLTWLCFRRAQYTLQMLDQDIMQAQIEGHDEPSFGGSAGITV